MKRQGTKSIFIEQMERIKQATNTRTQIELAEFLGISQSSVSDAGRRGRIPAEWLVTILRIRGVLPEWILTGHGPCYLTVPAAQGEYESSDTAEERRAKTEALQKLSSKDLADELLRRIAASNVQTGTRNSL